MPFIIENKGKIPQVLATFKALADYIKEHTDLKKLGERTLKNLLVEQGDEIIRGDYTIKRAVTGVTERYKRADPIIKNAVIDTIKYEYEEDLIDEGLEETKIEYNNDLIINGYNMYEFIKQVMDEIKKKGYDTIKNNFFRVIMEIDGNKQVSTPFVYFNTLYEMLIITITRWLNQYDPDEVLFKRVLIKMRSAPPDDELIIYGNNNKRIDAYIISLNSLIENMMIDNDNNKKLIKLADENYIYRPKTTKNCFIRACYMARDKKYEVLKKMERFIERHPIPTNELKEMAEFISYHLKLKINVYVLSDGLNKHVYNKGCNKKEINILIVANHAHALINKNDITDFNRDEFNLLMAIKEEEEEQILILKNTIKKRKKEEKKTNEEEHIDEDDEDKKEDDEDEEIKGKYADFNIATYDFETCDASMDGNDKQGTIPYAVGFYDGKEYKEIYKSNIIHLYNNKLDFKICHLIQDFVGSDEIIKEFNKYNDDLIKDDLIMGADTLKRWQDHKGKISIVDKFLNYLNNNEHKKLILYGHNAGKFDLYLMVRAILKKDGWTITSFLEQAGRIINLVIRTRTGKTIIFRDSFNFIACSLDAACKSFRPKTVKLEGDVNHDLINISNCGTSKIYEYTTQYLKNDCIALFEILNIYNDILIKKFNINIRDVLTNASIARQYYLNKFYDENKTPLYTLPKSIDKQLRNYYFGGRNECMTKLGYQQGKFYYLDFTSLYPFMMCSKMFPYGEVKTINIDGDVLDNNYFGFVRCKFRNVNKDSIPLHAVLKNNKLLFPHCDDWQESILTTEEIRYSINNNLGYEYYFYEVHNYDKKDYIFKECVEDLYQLKLKAEQDGNKALRSISKIIINSLYGFWGINFYNREQTEIVTFRDNKNANKKTGVKTADDKRKNKIQSLLLGQKLKNYNRVGKYHVFEKIDKIKTKCANVGLAFFTTSYARMHLYALLKDIKDRGGKTYYMDTDSVITDYNIYADEEMKKKWVGSGGEGLGELKNETGAAEGFYTEIITLGNKFYALKNNDLEENKIILKMKGVNSKAKYKKKSINFVNKTIYYKDLDKSEGKEKVTFMDYFLMSLGFNLNVSNMSFISGVNNVIIKRDDLIKLNNDKTVKKLYDKGKVDEYDNITPLVLKNNIKNNE
jgi:hypothetical protein